MSMLLLACVALGQPKPKPTEEDRKPFVSDIYLCTIRKPAGKEIDWKFTCEKMPSDGIVRLEHNVVMGCRVSFRCKKAPPGQKIAIDDSSIQKYIDSFKSNKGAKNQKVLKNAKTPYPSTGDECRILEAEYEMANSPDVWIHVAWQFVAKSNGHLYMIEASCPKSQWRLCKPQVDSIIAAFAPRAP
jgi:hypothetical protein